MKAKREPIAILCADLHLTLKQPACRADDDWMEVQKFYLDQVTELSYKLGGNEFVGKYTPVIIAGDIFDRWNPSPELLTFAFRHLPPLIYAVPGQHDLPNHQYEEMDRSGYGVLVESGRINNLGALAVSNIGACGLFGFGWGKEITAPVSKWSETKLFVAVIHQYVWKIGHSYPDAPESARIQSLNVPLGAYHVTVFGDNHKGFDVVLKSGTKVWNCGGFIRRKIDEMDYKPRLGILYSDGTIKEHLLDTSIDKFKPREELIEEMEVDLKSFVKELESLGDHGLDFPAAVRKALDLMPEVPGPVKEMALKCLE